MKRFSLLCVSFGLSCLGATGCTKYLGHNTSERTLDHQKDSEIVDMISASSQQITAETRFISVALYDTTSTTRDIEGDLLGPTHLSRNLLNDAGHVLLKGRMGVVDPQSPTGVRSVNVLGIYSAGRLSGVYYGGRFHPMMHIQQIPDPEGLPNDDRTPMAINNDKKIVYYRNGAHYLLNGTQLVMSPPGRLGDYTALSALSDRYVAGSTTNVTHCREYTGYYCGFRWLLSDSVFNFFTAGAPDYPVESVLYPQSVNNRGEVVGAFYQGDMSETFAAYSDASESVILSRQGFGEARARKITDATSSNILMTGKTYNGTPFGIRGSWLTDKWGHTSEVIPDFAAWDMNSQRYTVGYDLDDNRGEVIRLTSMDEGLNLRNLIDENSNMSSLNPIEINEEGQILTWVRTMDGRNFLTLLSPDRCLRSARGDANGDGRINNFDIDAFILGVSNRASFEERYPRVNMLCTLDVNHDGQINNFDLDPFIEILSNQ